MLSVNFIKHNIETYIHEYEVNIPISIRLHFQRNSEHEKIEKYFTLMCQFFIAGYFMFYKYLEFNVRVFPQFILTFVIS